MEDGIRQIEAAARAIFTLSGLHVVWKRADGMGEAGVSRSLCLHCNEFCSAVKQNAGRTRLCSQDDNVHAGARARSERCLFRKTCHAGVTELTMPLFLEQRFEGLLFVGPFRDEDSSCPYNGLQHQFEHVPQVSPEILSATEDLMVLMAGHVSLYLEWARRQQLQADMDPRIRDVLIWINENLTSQIHAADAARRCHLSISRFRHLFCEEVGEAFSKRMLRLRLEQAKNLLRQTRLRVVDIADETGFCNQNHFSQQFRRAMGISPLQYRKIPYPRNLSKFNEPHQQNSKPPPPLIYIFVPHRLDKLAALSFFTHPSVNIVKKGRMPPGLLHSRKTSR